MHGCDLAVATVVGKEHYDGVIVDVQFDQLVKQTTDALIDTLYHRGIRWIVLPVGRRFVRVSSDYFVLCLDGRMDGIVGKVEEERACPVFLYEPQRLVRQAVGQVLAGGAVRKILVSVRAEVRSRMPSAVPAGVESWTSAAPEAVCDSGATTS